MADDLSVAVERLRTSSQRLNTASDDAARTVRDVEEFLEELKVGVSMVVDVEPTKGQSHGATGQLKLFYHKSTNGRYRVMVGLVPEDNGDVVLRPWAEASRDEKLRSFSKLPRLLTLLSVLVDEQAEKAEQTVRDVTARLPLPKKRKGGDK